jgi:hypothetical protein
MRFELTFNKTINRISDNLLLFNKTKLKLLFANLLFIEQINRFFGYIFKIFRNYLITKL